MTISYTLGQRVATGLLSKIVGVASMNEDQVYIGYAMMTCAVSRCVMPFVNIEILESSGLQTLVGMTIALYIVAIGSMLVFADTLKPHYAD